MKTLREAIKEIQDSPQDLGGCLIIARTEKSNTFLTFIIIGTFLYLIFG